MAGERDVLAEAREILDRHIIRVARYYWPKGSHIETIAREAIALLDAARDYTLSRSELDGCHCECYGCLAASHEGSARDGG